MYGRYSYEFMKKIRIGFYVCFWLFFPPHRRKSSSTFFPSSFSLRLTPTLPPHVSKTGPQFKFSKILAVSLWSIFGKVVFLLVLHEALRINVVVGVVKNGRERNEEFFLINLEKYISWPGPWFHSCKARYSNDGRPRTRFPISHVYREMRKKI